MEYEGQKKSWWSQRTQLEKTLTIVCAVGTLVSIGLLVGLIVVAVNGGSDGITDEPTTAAPTTLAPTTAGPTTAGPTTEAPTTEAPTTEAPTTEAPTTAPPTTEATTPDPSTIDCLTPTCIQESAMLFKQMNLAADPCVDFYEFACGKFMRETVIPDDKTSVTAFSVIDTEMKDQLRVIVSEPIEAAEIESFKNVKRMYQACINTDLIESRGLVPVELVMNEMGRWPVVARAAWEEDLWTWESSMAASRANGYSVSYLFSFSVSTDNRDSTKRIMRIDQASLGLSREYFIETITHPFVEAYHNYQVELAVLWGADRAEAVAEMAEVLAFEKRLAEISMSREERRNAELLYNPSTIAELQASYDYVQWLPYLSSILPTEVVLASDDIVIVADLPFFAQLGELIDDTDKRVLANYVAWRQAASSVSYMPLRFRQLQQEYTRITTGRATEDPRWLTCVDTTLSYFPHAFGALYVREHFKEESKANVLAMVDNIKAEFKEMLKVNDWMDDDTKLAADAKADSIKAQMGYADELMDDAKIQEYYDTFGATVNEAQYYESVFGWNVASSARSNRRLREPVDKDDWTSEVAPAIVNAFYSSLENTIKFPAGILQGAFFNADRPQYMNYGGIGFVIGHEITHGFDDQGSRYDAEGNLRDWWAPETREVYSQRAQCIINQYSNFVEPLTNLNLNGVNTQGENIADNGGIKESYLAYVRWAAENPEPKLPGLDFTPKQLFWVSAGQIWCGALRQATMEARIRTGVHSPNQFRVIGPMSNSKEFAEDFKCAQTAPMNPASKCEVW